VAGSDDVTGSDDGSDSSWSPFRWPLRKTQDEMLSCWSMGMTHAQKVLYLSGFKLEAFPHMDYLAAEKVLWAGFKLESFPEESFLDVNSLAARLGGA